jgi:hypothetical protein
MGFPRHTKIYQSDGPEGGRTNGSTSLGDHRSDESSVGYSFVGCSPAEPTSASPTATSLSQHPAAVNCSAAKRNLSPFSLSHLRGPLHRVAAFSSRPTAYHSSMPLMSKKKQPFIIDENLSIAIKPYLLAGSKTTVECGLKSGTQDYPFVVDLCQREKAMLVTADIEFPRHIKKHQLARNKCLWGLLLLPGEEIKQINVLKRLKEGKIKLTHPHIPDFKFDYARHDNMFVNLRADPPTVSELCDCEWDDED